MTIELDSLIKQVGKLPSLPTVYYELSQEVDSPHSSLNSIGNVIRKDQGLAVRLLKLSNSAFYGLPSKVETLEEALQLIGLHQMRDIALATTVITLFGGLPPGLVEPNQFWRHSIACAVGAALLAEENEESQPERFFVGGLLHDIGRFIMYLRLPRESGEILTRCRQSGELPCVVENEVLGFDHALLGSALIEHWRLPASLVEMVGCHHHPNRARAAVMDAALVHVADFLASGLDLGNSGEYVVSPLSPPAWERCRIPEQRLGRLVKEMDTRSEAMSRILTSA
jgi:HD-like signal output (HDOD) protein